MDSLQIETCEPLEVPNILHSSYGLDAPLSNSCSTSQVLVSSFTLKEEGMLSKRKAAKAFFCLSDASVFFVLIEA
jgi:hypothetical protein